MEEDKVVLMEVEWRWKGVNSSFGTMVLVWKEVASEKWNYFYHYYNEQVNYY